MRTAYDAITPSNIRADAQVVCGYVDGRYAWTASDWARFPHASKGRIAVFASTNDGNILDVEPGNATPAQAPGWVQRRRAAGIDPTVYCSLSDWPAVKAAFDTDKVAQPHYWIAAYPGNGANLYPGSVAHQYESLSTVDISVVADYWPGVDPKPAPAPAPAPAPKPAPAPAPVPGPGPVPVPTSQEEIEMFTFSFENTVWLVRADGTKHKVFSPTLHKELGAIGVQYKGARSQEFTDYWVTA